MDLLVLLGSSIWQLMGRAERFLATSWWEHFRRRSTQPLALGAVRASVRCQIQITEYEGGWICQCFGGGVCFVEVVEATASPSPGKGRKRAVNTEGFVTIDPNN